MTLLGVPNVSEGHDHAVLDAIGAALTASGAARMLDVHADPDHDRAVFTVSGAPGSLAGALADGAREVLARIDVRRNTGLHPHVGALDVAPIVHLDARARGAACAEALVLGDLLGELGVPVFLYGALAEGRTRAQLRAGGAAGLAGRIRNGLRPDFGPLAPHRSAGVTLVAARPPLIAFNLELAPPATAVDARAIAAEIRESGTGGLPGLRAIGLELAARGGVAQVSCNVEDHEALTLAELLAVVERRSPVAEAELVGLAPRAAFDGWPDRVPVRNRATIEAALDGEDRSRSS